MCLEEKDRKLSTMVMETKQLSGSLAESHETLFQVQEQLAIKDNQVILNFIIHFFII